ncbi:MAG: uroporphyrinogen decarboxylase family protein [Candidatus Izemoplasmatales bacterium]|jgi:uroporphyrinogen decarboxylase|nr:uroporphyrinogen decarboxylase family protein [Candidatus Izemoplasmatales bacterium]MDD4988341.1 uroporphyrinogen decarboxylase family protein [Candidatus Izemoplasmatales bacterium]
MTNRERAIRILHHESVDRMVAVHFGYWMELLEEWADQGHIPRELLLGYDDGNFQDRAIDHIIGWDFNWYHTECGCIRLDPPFEFKVLETLPGGFQRVQNEEGLIVKIREGLTSIAAEDDYQLKDRDSFEKLYKPRMQYRNERIPVAYFQNEFNQQKRDVPIGLHLGSILGEVRNMLSVVGMSYLICDDFGLFQEIVDTYANMQYDCAKAVLKTGAKFDFAHYWEDVCYKNGPLINPAMFDELCAKHYQRRNDLVHRYGIDFISLDCDGVIDQLIPTWFYHGVNTLFPLEIGTWGDQFQSARKKYGNGLLGVGGMDKRVFLQDKAAVDKELERLEKIAQLKGFIPCPDHRIMPGSRFELVKYYAKKIKEIRF